MLRAQVPDALFVTVFQLEVEEAEKDRCEDNPEKLIPVEERKSQKRRRSAGVQAGKAQTNVGKYQEKLPSAMRRAIGGRCFDGLLGVGHAPTEYSKHLASVQWKRYRVELIERWQTIR